MDKLNEFEFVSDDEDIKDESLRQSIGKVISEGLDEDDNVTPIKLIPHDINVFDSGNDAPTCKRHLLLHNEEESSSSSCEILVTKKCKYTLLPLDPGELNEAMTPAFQQSGDNKITKIGNDDISTSEDEEDSTDQPRKCSDNAGLVRNCAIILTDVLNEIVDNCIQCCDKSYRVVNIECLRRTRNGPYAGSDFVSVDSVGNDVGARNTMAKTKHRQKVSRVRKSKIKSRKKRCSRSATDSDSSFSLETDHEGNIAVRMKKRRSVRCACRRETLRPRQEKANSLSYTSNESEDDVPSVFVSGHTRLQEKDQLDGSYWISREVRLQQLRVVIAPISSDLLQKWGMESPVPKLDLEFFARESKHTAKFSQPLASEYCSCD